MKIASGNYLATDNLENLSWTMSILRRLRPDIAESGNVLGIDFYQWLVGAGIKEYQSLRQHKAFRKLLDVPAGNTGLTKLQHAIYKFRKDVQAAFPLPEKQNEFLEWFKVHGVPEHCLEAMLSGGIGTGECAAREMPQFGVNLIGYAYGQLGIGEDLRMTARALKLAGIPFVIINFPPGSGVPQNDMSMQEYVSETAPYMFNIFCCTAMEMARFYVERGAGIFRNRYNIGYWPWELERWPEAWADLTRLADEVWVGSRHIFKALAPLADVPVLVMPLAVEASGASALGRRDFGLPEDSYIFCFSFDLHSSIQRKNPEACLKAFELAFPAGDEKVSLVVKCHAPAEPLPAWERLKAAAARDRRIIIVEETLSRPDLLALYRSCDCYLSLHRAEGFGRGIAEALLLGLDVIATGYSGNMDYCGDNPAVRTVDYALVPLQEGDYPFGDGQVWAEPALDHAAQQMRICAAAKNRQQAREFIFSLDAAAERYSSRLKLLWQELQGNN